MGIALKESANSELRRLLAYNESFHCIDDQARFLDIDETFQSQTMKVARYSVRKKAGEKDLSEGAGLLSTMEARSRFGHDGLLGWSLQANMSNP